MASHSDDDRGISKAWPFTLGATMIIAAMAWFCLGFAVKDATKTKELKEGKELWMHYELFWVLIIGALVLGVVGGIMNGRMRKAYVASH